MYRRPCWWSYENNVSSGVARGGTLGTRGFSRARREFSVLAEGRHKDLTETGKRARKVSGTQGTAAAGFLTMRTSCGEYLTLSEMINYEVTFRRNSRARSYYDGLEKMEY